jgi:hypothetical protein
VTARRTGASASRAIMRELNADLFILLDGFAAGVKMRIRSVLLRT